MKKTRLFALITVLIASAGAAHISAWQGNTGDDPAKARLFDGLGKVGRKITTASSEAQQFFDQGLCFLFAFNHDEAIRSFTHAATLDPKSAMPHWGIAVANGPHINNAAVDEAHAKAAWKALTQAQELAESAAPVEKALISALAKRYADPQPTDRKPLDVAYADAMKEAWRAYPKDSDVGALTAEALMDLRPWDLWTHDGKPQPGTEDITRILETVLEQSPDHPLALHLYIHAVEASPNPGRAEAAADRLRDLQPGLGHLVHMPSHIDVRLGNWQKAVVANTKALAADAAYRKLSPKQGFFNVYAAHNYHMLAYAALMQGESGRSTQTIKAMLGAVPADWVKANAAMVDGFLAVPFELHLRFGRWEAMLAEREPEDIFPLSRALWHFARGIAYTAQRKVDKAREEQQAFTEACKKVPKDSRFGNNAAADLLAVAERMLEGEILYRAGKGDEGIAALREAVKFEDVLKYAEPPDWMQPVRHALGAALMDARRFGDAENVYKEDLVKLPKNGWSLFGLASALKAQGKDEAAKEIDILFRASWKHADITLTSSCFCLPGK